MTELKNQNSENNTKYFGIGVGLLAATVCVFTLILYLGYLLKYAFIIPFISILVITSFIVMVVTAKRRADSLSNTYIADGYFNLALHVILLLVIGGIWQLIWIYRTTSFTNNDKSSEFRNPVTKLLLNMFIPFYSIYWIYVTAQRIDNISKSNGNNSEISMVCLICGIFIPFVSLLIIQNQINKVCNMSVINFADNNNKKSDTEELREYMAKLGVRTVDELVGRTDLLKVKDVPTSRRAAMLDLSSVLYNPYAKEKKGMIFNPKKVYDFELGKTLDEKVLVKQLLPALERGEKRGLEVDVTNTDRAFGTIFGSEITRRYPEGLEEDSFVIQCKGAGGQSFGAFIPKGLTLELTGDSNDYFGKGLSGGKLVVCQPKGVKFKSDENIIIGNVALYGATSGKVFVGGVAGERFAVRNSGVRAVVEGVGDHGCEYMTGGCVVVLGQVGKNFAAGMSGGIAYVLDLDSRLYQKVNKAMVNIERVTDKYDVQELKGMIQEHVAYTNSEVGKKILDNFKEYLPKFKKIIPEDYEKMMSTIIQMEEKGLSREKAKIEAFNLIKNGR